MCGSHYRDHRRGRIERGELGRKRLLSNHDELATYCFDGGNFALGFGARLVAPLFARPGAWRILDGVVGVTMLALAAALVLGL